MQERILIVDDDIDVLKTLKFALTIENYDPVTVTNGRDALEIISHNDIALVITDIKMPVMSGVELIRHIREREFGNEIEIIVLTGYATVDIAVDVMKNGGAFDFLLKPLEDVNQLFLTIKKALKHKQLCQQNRELIAQISKLSAAVEQSPNIVIITNKKGEVEYVNPKFTAITGYRADEVYSKHSNTLGSPNNSKDMITDMWNTILDGREWRGDLCNRKKSGEIYWERASIKALKDADGQITHFVKVAEDITERKLMEKNLIHNHKMQAVVTLAGGIAHKFNNSLTAITGFTELLKMSLFDEEAQEWLSLMQSSSENMIALTKKLIAFSEQGKYENRAVSLNEVIEDTFPLIENILSSKIEIVLDLSNDLKMIKADPSQMQMVIYELIINGVEAIGENSGTINISSKNSSHEDIMLTYYNQLYLRESIVPQKDIYTTVTVKDSGGGIDISIKDRIFEPFFTTKFLGRGMGLAAVYGIIKNHNGAIFVSSESGKSTEFKIILPSVLEGI